MHHILLPATHWLLWHHNKQWNLVTNQYGRTDRPHITPPKVLNGFGRNVVSTGHIHKKLSDELNFDLCRYGHKSYFTWIWNLSKTRLIMQKRNLHVTKYSICWIFKKHLTPWFLIHCSAIRLATKDCTCVLTKASCYPACESAEVSD